MQKPREIEAAELAAPRSSDPDGTGKNRSRQSIRRAIPVGHRGLRYDAKVLARALHRQPEPSWNLMFDPRDRAPARRLRHHLAGQRWLDHVPSGLALAIGRDPASEDLADLRAAEAAFMRVRPYVRYIESGSRNRTDLASGEICMTVGPSGEMLQARALALESRSGAEVVTSSRRKEG